MYEKQEVGVAGEKQLEAVYFGMLYECCLCYTELNAVRKLVKTPAVK